MGNLLAPPYHTNFPAMNTKTRQGTRAVWAGEEEYLLGATQVPVVLSAAFGYKDMEEWLDVARGKAKGVSTL